MSPLRTVQFGLGPIGQASARLALDQGHTLVGALDLDPDRVGRDLGEVLGRDALGIPIRDDAAAALAELAPDVVLHTTVSFLDRIEGQLMDCISAGAHVVSSSEELFWPFERDAG
ncbi:MAG: dihydrodipicolinate reductase, partial [Bacteroidota bacterium]